MKNTLYIEGIGDNEPDKTDRYPIYDSTGKMKFANNMQDEEWKKTFEDKFVAHITSKPGNIEHDRAVIFFEDVIKIQDFISSLLQKERSAMRQKMIAELYQNATMYSDGSADNMHRYIERMYPDLLKYIDSHDKERK